MLLPLFVVALGWFVAVVAGDKGACAQETHSMSLSLTSAAFTEGGTIPKRYACEGENVSPPLTWTDVPAGTKNLVLITRRIPDPQTEIALAQLVGPRIQF
jgi:phosphatidylethanolamine-binding protein (PEBP) family uncharacterized protein